jgi:hypothetical protein
MFQNNIRSFITASVFLFLAMPHQILAKETKLSDSARFYQTYHKTLMVVLGSEIASHVIAQALKESSVKKVICAAAIMGLLYGALYYPDTIIGYSSMWEPKNNFKAINIESKGLITTLVNCVKKRN